MSRHWGGYDRISHERKRTTQTLLRQLFEHTETMFEAEKAGNAWLDLLAIEGYNVRSYLDQERSEAKAQEQLMLFHCDFSIHDEPIGSLNVSQILSFQFEGTPRVSWMWQCDPSSTLFLLHQEFQQMLMTLPEYWHIKSRPWAQTWPFGCSSWMFSSNAAMAIPERNFDEFAQERAHRPMEKKGLKASRALRSRSSVKIPGAWPL